MKVYGETIFDIIYLVFAILSGIYILTKSKNNIEKSMGVATLVLGLGDSFHLVPRMLDYFIDKDWNLYLGVGKLITSITMTIFYGILYYSYQKIYRKEDMKLTYTVIVLSVLRIILCLFPQNNWTTNDSPLLWGILRNIPFLVLGIIMIILFFQNRKDEIHLKNMWILILLSFLFYIPVVVGAGTYPILGMFMLPKTICYMGMIISFIKYVRGSEYENHKKDN